MTHIRALSTSVVAIILLLLLTHHYLREKQRTRRRRWTNDVTDNTSSSSSSLEALQHQQDAIITNPFIHSDKVLPNKDSHQLLSSSWSASTQTIPNPFLENDPRLLPSSPNTRTKGHQTSGFRPCLDLVRCDRPCEPSAKLPTCIPNSEVLWTETIAQSAYTHFVDSAVEMQRLMTHTRREDVMRKLERGGARGRLDAGGGPGRDNVKQKTFRGCHCPAPQCMMWLPDDERESRSDGNTTIFLGPHAEDIVEGARWSSDELIASFGRCVASPYFARELHRNGDDEDLVCSNTPPSSPNEPSLWSTTSTTADSKTAPTNESILVKRFQQQTSWMFRQWFPWDVTCIPTKHAIPNSSPSTAHNLLDQTSRARVEHATAEREMEEDANRFSAFHSGITGLFTYYNGCINPYGLISGYKPRRVDEMVGVMDFEPDADEVKYFGRVRELRHVPSCFVGESRMEEYFEEVRLAALSRHETESNSVNHHRRRQPSAEGVNNNTTEGVSVPPTPPLPLPSLDEYLRMSDDSPPDVILIPLVRFTSNHMHVLHRAASAIVASKYFAWVRRRRRARQRRDELEMMEVLQRQGVESNNNTTLLRRLWELRARRRQDRKRILDPTHDELHAFPDRDEYLKEILFVFVSMDTSVQVSSNTYSFYYPLMTHKWAGIFAFKPSKEILHTIHSKRHRKLLAKIIDEEVAQNGNFEEQKQTSMTSLCFRKIVVMHQCLFNCNWWQHSGLVRSIEERFESITIGRRHFKRDGAALQLVRNRIQRCLRLPDRTHANTRHPRVIYAVRTASRRHTQLALRIPKIARLLFSSPYSARSFDVVEHTQLKPADVFRLHWFGDMLLGHYGGGLAYGFLLPPGAVLNQISHPSYLPCGSGGWSNGVLNCDYTAEAELLQVVPLLTELPVDTAESTNFYSIGFRITLNVYEHMFRLMFCALRLVRDPAQYSKMYLNGVAEASQLAYEVPKHRNDSMDSFTINATLDDVAVGDGFSSRSELVERVRRACPYDNRSWDFGREREGDF